MGESTLACLQNRADRKEGASTGGYEDTSQILVLPSSCGSELAAPQPSVSAAAAGAGLQIKENVKTLFSNFFPSPSLLCAQSCAEN